MLSEQFKALDLRRLDCPVEDCPTIGVTGHQIGTIPVEKTTSMKAMAYSLLIRVVLERINHALHNYAIGRWFQCVIMFQTWAFAIC